MAEVDPCACDAKCRHGQRCMAGHANYPDLHWYLCETCSPRHATVYAVLDRRYLAVMAACGHVVGPYARASDLALAGREHRRACDGETPGFTCPRLHATAYLLADRRYLAVMARCGHAVGPYARSDDLAVAGLEHRRTCSRERPGFTCPRCGRTSQHPGDDIEGYCGHCHDWTGQPRRESERDPGAQPHRSS